MEYKNAKLIIEKWSEPANISFGTIRTNPENYYVSTILNNGYLKFEGIEPMTKDFPQDKVKQWFNNTMRMPQKEHLKMNNYKVIGESRQVGAIGIFEPFTINIAAGCAKWAYDDVRNRLYSNNREHVLIKEIRIITDDNKSGVVVEPSAYLYR